MAHRHAVDNRGHNSHEDDDEEATIYFRESNVTASKQFTTRNEDSHEQLDVQGPLNTEEETKGYQKVSLQNEKEAICPLTSQ